MTVKTAVETVEDAPKLATKRELIAALHATAEIEQQFMCQYLYAVFSLKKNCDEECSSAELEAVRRWASNIYMIARQEMEHLSVVNSLLTAVGGTPCYAHRNFPSLIERQLQPLQALATNALEQALPATEPCAMPFVLEPFTLTTARRFTCMEAPHLVHVRPPERQALAQWCYEDEHGNCNCVSTDSKKSMPEAQLPFATETIEIGSVEELYAELRRSIEYLCATLGESKVFNGHDSGQSQIPSEYMITLFPVKDRSSALAAIDMVTRQGEGIDAPPGYESHFMRFFLIAEEYEALDRAARAEGRSFCPFKPLPNNPKPSAFEPGSVAHEAVSLFRKGYVTLLHMLTGYYQGFQPDAWANYPYLSQALEQTAFAPMMTMFVRSLAEVIVDIPTPNGVAGPSFDLTRDEIVFLHNPTNDAYGELKFYHDALTELCTGLESLLGRLDQHSRAHDKVLFIFQTVSRVSRNLSEIYEQGIFPNFNPQTA